MPTLYETMIKIGVDASELDKGFDDAESKVKGFGNTAKGVFAGNLIYDGVKKISGAIVGFAKDSVQAGMDFDKAMSQVQATMLKTDKEMEESIGSVDTAYGHFEGNLRDFAQFLGKNTAYSATQAAEALNYMALAGYDTQESMDMLPNVLNLAAAGNMDLAQASDMVTDAQTALGIAMEDMPQYIDELAKAASTGNTSVEQLGSAFLTIGGLAKEVNGGFVTLADGTEAPVSGIQELEIAMTAMANAGIKGNEAGTHMRNMLMKLSSPTSDGTKALEAMGVAVFDADGKMRSLSDIFGELNVALGDMTQEDKINAISDLFNARDLASAEALLGAIESDWDEIGASILDADGAAAAMAEIQLDNLAGDVTKFQSALEGAQLALSDGLSPALRGFVQTGTGLLSQFTDAFTSGGIQGVVDKGIELIDGLASGAQKALPKLIPTAMKAVMSFSENLRANAGKLVDSGLNLIMTLSDALIQNIPVFVQTIPTIISNIAGIINDNAPKLISAGITLIGNLVQGIIDAWPTIVEEFPKIIQAILDVWQAVNWWQIGANIITFIVNGVKGLVSALPSALKSIGEAGINVIKGINWAAAGKAIIQFILNGVKALVSSIPSALAVMARNGMSKVTNVNWASVGRTVINKIKSGVSSLVSSIPSKLKEIANNAKRKFSEISWSSVGSNIVSGIVKGIANGAGSIASAAKDAARNAFNAAKNLLKISSPSKLFRDEVGKMISLGMAEGITDGEDDVDDAVGGLVDTTLDPFDSFTSVEKTGTTETVGGDTYVFNLYGVNDPEDFANRAVRQFKLQARTV